MCGQSQAASHHSYEITLDAANKTLAVVARLAGDKQVFRLQAEAGQWSDLLDVKPCQGETGVVRQGRRALRLNGSCFRYTVQLLPIEGRIALPWTATAWMSRPARFMWLPDDDLPVKVSFDTADLPISLPWQRRRDAWWIYPAARSGRSAAVFGGQVLNLGLDQPGVFLSTQADPARARRVEQWLLKYVRVLDELLDGHYPPELQVIAIDVRGTGRSPVPFGHVVREQGTSVRFFVAADSSIAELTADWTAPHELAHVLLPYVEARWISEGFASYYQNVLLARAGEYTPVQAWAKLRERFARAQEQGRRSTPAAGDTRLLTYWSGAALALRLDIQLRQRGTSLDAVLAELARCCLPARQSYSAMELARKLDQLAGYNLAVPLVRKYRHRRGMPRTEDLFTEQYQPLRAAIMQVNSRR